MLSVADTVATPSRQSTSHSVGVIRNRNSRANTTIEIIVAPANTLLMGTPLMNENSQSLGASSAVQAQPITPTIGKRSDSGTMVSMTARNSRSRMRATAWRAAWAPAGGRRAGFRGSATGR